LRNRESLHAAGEAGHGGLLRIEPIIDPFLCLLKEAVFSFGFYCKSIDCSSHNESPKHPAFGIFNSSSGAPVKSGGASLYRESDSVPAIPVHFWHSSPTLSQGQSEKQDQTEARPPRSSHARGCISAWTVSSDGCGRGHKFKENLEQQTYLNHAFS
jgi:hypothetical protein